MFVCIECSHVCDEPVRIKEPHGLGYGHYEMFYACPKCGEALVKAYKCDCCDEYITGDYIKTFNDKRFCENCYYGCELGEED